MSSARHNSGGYVGIDADTGRVLWKDSSLINPSLPIMDISGDIIGSDGRYLTKVDGNGNVEKPVIPLDPLMTPVYSIVFGEGNILFIVSQTGELVAYLANGIPLASLVLRGNVERYNGTFHPIAQPIMKGSRAYILTQFQPDPQDATIPQEKLGTLAMQRLYAMDILDRMVKPIDIVWYLNLELEVKVNYREPVKSKKSPQYEPKQTSKDIDGSKQRPIARISREAVHPRNPDKMNQSRLSRNKHATLEHDTRLKYKTADRAERNSFVLDMLKRSIAKGGKSFREPTNSLRNPAHRHDVSSDVLEMVQHESIQFIGTGNTNKYQNSGTSRTGNTKSGTSGTGGYQKDRHPPSNIRHQWSQQTSEQSSLSYFFGTVMASVAPPIGICDMLTLEEHRQSCLESSFSRLVGIQDLGTNMSLLYSNNFSLSHMSVYDSSYGRMGLHSSWNTSIKQEDADPKHDKTQATHTQQRTRLGEGSLVWAVTQFGDTINGFDQISSQVQQIANVSQMLNTTVQVTSRVMVALDPKTHADLLLFAVRRVNKTEPHSSFNATNYLVALDTSFGDGEANIMWTFPVPYDYEVQGQIAVLEVPWVNSTSPLLVATAQGPVSQIAFAFNFTQTL
ncbi:uncharacterized protein LOC124268518 isoform X2 [Haliotis rubra]|uniref:uncharacterized protein LOC124268518 isoform X2 n=1 Tax=Haliotis rubra TaxID=36100 RepID=UPI001EE50D33|nr:uncharacterized protein LOC124268518 isoform X2 [Haliotis rubra]